MSLSVRGMLGVTEVDGSTGSENTEALEVEGDDEYHMSADRVAMLAEAMAGFEDAAEIVADGANTAADVPTAAVRDDGMEVEGGDSGDGEGTPSERDDYSNSSAVDTSMDSVETTEDEEQGYTAYPAPVVDATANEGSGVAAPTEACGKQEVPKLTRSGGGAGSGSGAIYGKGQRFRVRGPRVRLLLRRPAASR